MSRTCTRSLPTVSSRPGHRGWRGSSAGSSAGSASGAAGSSRTGEGGDTRRGCGTAISPATGGDATHAPGGPTPRQLHGASAHGRVDENPALFGRAGMTDTANSGTASPPRGVRLSRDARRIQLLGAARDVFAAQGYHAAAMDDIAERAGVSKPVLYQHFPGKLDLYHALLTTYADELANRLRAAIEHTTDNHDRVHGAVAAYFDFVAGEGEAFRLVFESDLRGE